MSDKKPFMERFSPRTLRIIFTVFSVLAFAAGAHNFTRFMITDTTGNDQCAWRPIPGVGRLLITDVVEGGVADVAGVKNEDTLLAVNGQRFKNPGEAQKILNTVPRGQYAMYTINRGGRILEIRVQVLKLFDIRALSLWLLGFGFLVVGYIVVMTRPQGKIQRLFGWYGIVSMLFFGLFILNLAYSAPVLMKVAYLT